MSRRPATGEYSEFEWGKYDKRRKAQWTSGAFSVINPILSNPDTMTVARDYPNLTRAYFEAVGATVKAEDPIRQEEQRKAVYEFNFFASERREERERNEIEQLNQDRRTYLREEYGRSDMDEEDSFYDEEDAQVHEREVEEQENFLRQQREEDEIDNMDLDD